MYNIIALKGRRFSIKVIKKTAYKLKRRMYSDYSSYIIYNETPHIVDINQAKIDITVQPLNDNDFEKYIQARPTNTKQEFFKRLSKGDIGIAAFFENKIIGYHWLTTKECKIPEHNIMINPPKNFYYGYDGFTHPEFRRLGVNRELRQRSYSFFLENNLKFSISTIAVENLPSIGSAKKVGEIILGVLKTRFILGFTFHSIITENVDNYELIKKIFSL